MPDSQLMTKEGAVLKATAMKTAFAAGKMRLFKSSLVPSYFTTAEALEEAECDFSGYPAGGATVTAWTGPAAAPGGGAVITTPVVNFSVTDPDPDPIVPNEVGGWWYEDGTNGVRLVGRFDPPRQMAQVLDFITLVVQDIEGKNPPAPSE